MGFDMHIAVARTVHSGPVAYDDRPRAPGTLASQPNQRRPSGPTATSLVFPLGYSRTKLCMANGSATPPCRDWAP